MNEVRIMKGSGAWPMMLVMLFGVVLAGCDEDPAWKKPGPKNTVDAFLMHWLRGEQELAFEYILPADRERLTAPLAQLEDVPEKQRPQPHEMLVVAGVTNLYDIAKMEVKGELESAPKEGQTVTVTLHRQDGTTSDAQLVWSDGRWFVDLPLENAGSEG